MQNYIAQSGDTIESIALKFNVSYEDLIQLNKIHKNKIVLDGSHFIIPDNGTKPTETREVQPKSPFISRLAPLKECLINYDYTLKEIVMAAYHNKKGLKELQNTLLQYKSCIAKTTNAQASRTPAINKMSSLDTLLIDLVDAIQKHGIDKVKETLKKIKDWPKALADLLQNGESRDESLKELLETDFEKWRDYVLAYGSEEYKESEKIFKDILSNINPLVTKLIKN